MNLNRYLRHEGVNPNRALLGVMLSMYLDAETEEEQELFFMLLKSVWGSPRLIRWSDKDDPPAEDFESPADRQAESVMRDVLGKVLSGLTSQEHTEEEAEEE